jgi:hypothetical protein
MREHRPQIGAALLGSVAVFVAAGATTAASNVAGWGNPIVIGLLALALLCLAGALIAFRPVPSGNAKMNRLIARQYRSMKRRRTIRRLLRAPKEQPVTLTIGRSPTEQAGIKAGRSITAGEDIEAAGAVEAGEAIEAGGSIHAGGPLSQTEAFAAQLLQKRRQREHWIKTGEDLALLILRAEGQDEDSSKGRQALIYNLAARIESWARTSGVPDEAPKFSGDPAADLARLKVFVARELARLHADQEQS